VCARGVLPGQIVDILENVLTPNVKLSIFREMKRIALDHMREKEDKYPNRLNWEEFVAFMCGMRCVGGMVVTAPLLFGAQPPSLFVVLVGCLGACRCRCWWWSWWLGAGAVATAVFGAVAVAIAASLLSLMTSPWLSPRLPTHHGARLLPL
jgi:hypothetical protein